MVLDGRGVEDGHGVGDDLAICVRAAVWPAASLALLCVVVVLLALSAWEPVVPGLGSAGTCDPSAGPVPEPLGELLSVLDGVGVGVGVLVGVGVTVGVGEVGGGVDGDVDGLGALVMVLPGVGLVDVHADELVAPTAGTPELTGWLAPCCVCG